MAALSGDLRRNLTMLARGGTKRELGRAMYEEESVDAKEVVQRTPVLTGNLRGTITVKGPVFEQPDKVRVWIQAGGGVASDYAVPVHENLEAFHKVGQAKYLESVVQESAPHILKRVADRFDWRRGMK